MIVPVAGRPQRRPDTFNCCSSVYNPTSPFKLPPTAMHRIERMRQSASATCLQPSGRAQARRPPAGDRPQPRSPHNQNPPSTLSLSREKRLRGESEQSSPRLTPRRGALKHVQHASDDRLDPGAAQKARRRSGSRHPPLKV